MSEVEEKPRRRRTATTEAVPPPPAPAPTRELTEEEKKFLDSLTNLVTSAQELSYVLASINLSAIKDRLKNDEGLTGELDELVEASRNVVRAVKVFHSLVKTRMGTRV